MLGPFLKDIIKVIIGSQKADSWDTLYSGSRLKLIGSILEKVPILNLEKK